MGIDDIIGKAKDALKGHEDQVSDALDKGAEAIKSRTGDSTDSRIDDATDKAKDFLRSQKDPGQK
ncbi:antitoxin [Pengzhenrongella frigida]|uniref:Antitoxin n=1 Tax=Pengzhenrongella frigida TaxID=1259133 RepID=A0A4Q5MWU8_9MICO|nr:antitoxin [Cellulomonas sp. HLT2-17]RYV50182.1 antitoxin [Cellulomonas sp. HLT2-17]